MSATWVACRYRTVVNGWTCEVFMSGGGGWWGKVYDAQTGKQPMTPLLDSSFERMIDAQVACGHVANSVSP